MASVRIPPVLRPIVDEQTTLTAEGSTLGEALDTLFVDYPALKERMIDPDGTLRRFVNVYVDSEDVRTRDGLDTPLTADSSIIVLPAMAGGQR